MPKKRKFNARSSKITPRRKGKQLKKLTSTREESSIDPTIDLAHDSSPSEPSPSLVSLPPATRNAPPNVPPPRAAAKESAKGNTIDYNEMDDYEKVLFDSSLRRLMIAGQFVKTHGMEQDESKWGGKTGIIAEIKRNLDIPRGTDIRAILRSVIMHYELGENIYWRHRIGKNRTYSHP